jgi:hypothetical protein
MTPPVPSQPGTLDQLREAATFYDHVMTSIGGCMDGGCVIVKPKGMVTNGGCRCMDDRLKARRVSGAANHLRNAVRVLLSAAPPPPEVEGGWRPIESAPKDGTVIDVWQAGEFPSRWTASWRKQDHQCISEYCDMCPTKHEGRAGWRDCIFGDDVLLRITHWMPVPPPPSNGEG